MEIRKIRGQGTGITWNYFLMLSGNDSFCKPDRQLLGFISEALKGEIKNIAEAQNIMLNATAILKKTYPNITVRLLDHTIWVYMTELNKVKR
jgi:hypothetical protein